MKHLVRLYPNRWRRRYGDEVAELATQRGFSLPAVLDLFRGALNERLRRSGVLVYVPTLGFRPLGTRVLRESTEAERDATSLRAVAVAASPESTDVLVEWERRSDAADCATGPYLSAMPVAPPELNSAQLAYGNTIVSAESIHRGAFSTGMYGMHAFHTLRFPALPREVPEAELRVREGASDFALPLNLTTAATRARTLDGAHTRAGVTVRTTSLAWQGDELVVGVEVASTWSVGQVGAPMPPQPQFRGVTDDVRRARQKEMRRVFARRFDPLRLELPDGSTIEELRRLFPVNQQRPQDGAIVQRFAVVFPAPARAELATLFVPFVELSDHSSRVEVDLRRLPSHVTLAGRAFTVLAAEPYGSETKVSLQLPAEDGERTFVQPASFEGSGGSYSWNREANGRIWFAGPVGDPPLVRFIGVVERVGGPWRVPVELTP